MQIKTLLYRIPGLVFLVLLGFALLYVASKRSQAQCKALRVSVASPNQAPFVSPKAIEQLITLKVGDPVGKPLYAINTHDIETLVDKLPVVKKSQAYVLASGDLCVRIQQRVPILRIIASNGASCYVTWNGALYPSALDYAAHTLVANGYINAPIDSLTLQDPRQGIQSHLFTQLLDFARFVYQHPFWHAQLTQLYVAPGENVELIPRIGGQIIQLGPLDNYQYKLRKLRALYAANLPNSGLNAYNEIDLRFGDQVICRTPTQN